MSHLFAKLQDRFKSSHQKLQPTALEKIEQQYPKADSVEKMGLDVIKGFLEVAALLEDSQRITEEKDKLEKAMTSLPQTHNKHKV